ncbi:MAG TPA: IclR family transcriptional regulator C-terminal domain-containing protein [Solirubrobacteraceae bacterium]|nr:IclR family transcriptional regulator C-terminal domain-containing protein [Solirubrobacteraceae bacterium]
MLQTLQRAGDVLDLFTAEEPEWGVTATAQRLGVGKSLAHDALASLAAIGLLQRVGHGRYRLGWRNLSLAAVLLRTSDLSARARPVVRELADRQNVTVSLVAWDRGRIVYINRRHRPCGEIDPGPAPGATVPLDGSAAARVLLASRPDDEVTTLWSDGLVHSGHCCLADLRCDLECVRRDGWAIGPSAHPQRHDAVAAPVRDRAGAVAAAVSLDLAGGLVASGGDLGGRMVVAAASRITEALRRCVAAG